MTTYKTFKRSCTNWREFANAPKEVIEIGLTREEAVAACQQFNNIDRTEQDKLDGTKMEFTAE